MYNIDVVIPLVYKDLDKIKLIVKQLNSYLNIKNIFILTSKKNFESLKLLNLNCIILDENVIIDGITLDKIKEFFKDKGFDIKRAGWYFQQFLKMYISYNKLIGKYYLIWDSDTILLNKIKFFDKKGNMLLSTTNEYHLPYFNTLKKILNLDKQIKESFISEHMIIKKEYMISLIKKIKKRAGKINWVEYILLNIDERHINGSGFSEFETYGSYIFNKHKKEIIIRKLKKLRTGTYFFGNIPNKYSLFFLRKIGFKIVSFEEWNRGYSIIIFLCKIISFIYYQIFKFFEMVKL